MRRGLGKCPGSCSATGNRVPPATTSASRDILGPMPFVVTEFESTPNPNAVKCWLDRPISDGPRSFLNPSMAAGDPLARAIFQQTGATTLLFNGDWLTVNKPPEANWATVKAKIRKVLAEAETL